MTNITYIIMFVAFVFFTLATEQNDIKIAFKLISRYFWLIKILLDD